MVKKDGSTETAVSSPEEQEVYLLGLVCCHSAEGDEIFRRWSIVYPARYGGNRERFEQLLHGLVERGQITVTPHDSGGWSATPLPAGRARFLRRPVVYPAPAS